MTDEEALLDVLRWSAERAAERKEQRNPFPAGTEEAVQWQAAYDQELKKRQAYS